jgi:hypothetical protein
MIQGVSPDPSPLRGSGGSFFLFPGPFSADNENRPIETRKEIAMRVFTAVLLVSALGWFAPPFLSAQPQWNLGVSVGSEGLRGFHFSIGEHYRVPERDIGFARQRGIPEEELPVVFYLAAKAQVASAAVLDLRLKGLSWMDITVRYGLSPEIYYVPVKTVKKGPPFGKAYGYYQKHPRQGWKKLKFRDDEIINQVNLKFASDYYGYAPDRIMEMRGEGRDFVYIHDRIHREKRGKGKNSDQGFDDKGRGKGKGGRGGKGKD